MATGAKLVNARVLQESFDNREDQDMNVEGNIEDASNRSMLSDTSKVYTANMRYSGFENSDHTDVLSSVSTYSHDEL